MLWNNIFLSLPNVQWHRRRGSSLDTDRARGEQGFFFAVWSTSKPIKLFEMFAYVTLPNGAEMQKNPVLYSYF